MRVGEGVDVTVQAHAGGNAGGKRRIHRPAQVIGPQRARDLALLRQPLLQALIIDIIVDFDDDAQDVVLTIHWRGG